jgi:hypothetical protein
LTKRIYIFSLRREPIYLILNSFSILKLNVSNLRLIWIVVNILGAVDAVTLKRSLLIIIHLSILNLCIEVLNLVNLNRVLTELILKS